MRDDAVYFMMNRFPVAAALYAARPTCSTYFRREFDAAYDEGGIFQLTMHPHVIGYRSRIWILEEIIRHAKACQGVWFATHAEVVDGRNTARPEPVERRRRAHAMRLRCADRCAQCRQVDPAQPPGRP